MEDDDDDDTRVLCVTMGNNVNVPKHLTEFGSSSSPIISLWAAALGVANDLKHPVLSKPAGREKTLDMLVI